MRYAIDFKDRKNLTAYEIPSAVGMTGLYIPELVAPGCNANSAEYDFKNYRFQSMLRSGQVRPISILPH